MTRKPLRRLYGIFGAGGCGRGVLPVARSMLADAGGDEMFELVFVDDSPASPTVNGYPVRTFDEFVAEPAAFKRIAIAVADSASRKTLAARIEAAGLELFSVISPQAIRMDAVTIGDGAVISPFVTITSNIRIGEHFHANLYSYVEHDCVIGDFVTFAPSVRCNGNVVIGDHAYLGAGCIIRQGEPGKPLVIGPGATVGMGAVVTKDVPAGVTVIGVPARPVDDGAG